MASTDGKITLVERLTNIANAIRGKTKRSESLSMEDMVNEINNEWVITCYIKDFYIQDDGNHTNTNGEAVSRDSDWDYFDSEPIGPTLSKGPVVYSYTPENHVVLTARPNSGNYENIQWNLSHVPDGSNITIYRKNITSGWDVTGNSDKYESCILTGIDKYCKMFIDCGSKDSGKDSIQLNIHIYYI